MLQHRCLWRRSSDLPIHRNRGSAKAVDQQIEIQSLRLAFGKYCPPRVDEDCSKFDELSFTRKSECTGESITGGHRNRRWAGWG